MAGVIIAAAFAACGGSGAEPEATARPPAPHDLKVTLDGLEGPQNVGILMAVEQGYFEDVGLEVSAANPIEPNRPISYIAKGTDDIGLAQEPQVEIGEQKGMPIEVIGTVISRPTAALIWLKGSGIDGVDDLKGKRIAVPGIPYQERFLRDLLEREGLRPAEVEIVPAPYELVPNLTSGQVDAIFGGSWNLEGAELEVLGAEFEIRRVQDLGSPEYEELVVIASADLVEDYPQVARKFMSALRRGTRAVVGHPAVAVKAIESAPGADTASSRKALEAQTRATLPLLSTSGAPGSGQR